jgi:hypothetical protein
MRTSALCRTTRIGVFRSATMPKTNEAQDGHHIPGSAGTPHGLSGAMNERTRELLSLSKCDGSEPLTHYAMIEGTAAIRLCDGHCLMPSDWWIDPDANVNCERCIDREGST